MTPEERAVTIVALLKAQPNQKELREVAAEIRAAVKETKVPYDCVSIDEAEMKYKEAKADAYADASKIVSGWHIKKGGYTELAATILARAAELNRQCDQYHCGHEACNKERGVGK